MSTNCEIILDLIPLYLEKKCSEESRRAVEKHISECENCREAFSRMKHEQTTVSPVPSEEESLIKPSWTITRTQLFTAISILAIALFWALYLWQRKMYFKNLQYFSFNLYNILTFLLYPVLLASLVWFVITLGRAISYKNLPEKTPRIIILGLLLVVQVFLCSHILLVRENMYWTEVLEVPDQNSIIIERYDGSKVVLETDRNVTSLVRTDGTEYVVFYTANINSPANGDLMWIIPAEDAVTSDNGK